MKKTNQILGFLISFLLLGHAVFAGGIITAKDLAKIINNDDVVLVSLRKPADYQKVHITGAVNFELKQLYKEGDIKGLIKSPEEIAAILGENGINENKKIVIYCNTGNNAGRLYWILDYLGAKDVWILDGHMTGWRAARKPVTKAPSKVKAATFTPNVDDSKLATMAEVQNALNKANYVIVDARSEKEYNGLGEDKALTRKGHISGAVNLEFKKILNDETKTIKPKEELQSIFTNAGITSDKKIILYCASSARAGILYFALNEILAYENVEVYDGALYQWQTVDSNEIVK